MDMKKNNDKIIGFNYDPLTASAVRRLRFANDIISKSIEEGKNRG